MYVEKVKERYTRHTRTVTYTDSNGKTKTRTEVYWTWDRVSSEDKMCKELSFCDVVFGSNKIDVPGAGYITTIKESSHVRYKYYGTGTKFTGTIFADLRDKTISKGTNFYNNMTIEETVKHLENGIVWLILFWFFWVILIAGCVMGFYYLDNKWLE